MLNQPDITGATLSGCKELVCRAMSDFFCSSPIKGSWYDLSTKIPSLVLNIIIMIAN